jgi:hypothetical protein
VLALLAVPEVLDSWSYSQQQKRINQEKQKIAELVQAGDRGYEDLVRLVPSLWHGNVTPALKGILVQTNRDRVADLCAIYVACGQNHNTKEAIARVLGQLGDSRASIVLIKDLESVWPGLSLIQYDAQIEALGSIKAKDAGDILVKIVRYNYSWSSWRIKEEAFVALGKIGDERALPDAAQHIGADNDFYIEQGAMNYLTHIGSSGAKSILMDKYQIDHSPDLALCLVQLGDMSVLPDMRSQLKVWLDNYSLGGWGHTDFWGIFYCVRALLIANDIEATPDFKRALLVFTKGDNPVQHYVDDDAHGYSGKLLLDESKADTLVSDLGVFLKEHP